MVAISQIWMDYTINEAQKIANRRKIKAPMALKVYMNDTFGIMQKKPATLHS